MTLQFEEVVDGTETLRVPIITFGRGDGVTHNSSKGRIYKSRTGIMVEYYQSNTGNRIAVELTDEGIIQQGNTGAKGLRNVHVAGKAPKDPQMNDLWIDTTGGV